MSKAKSPIKFAGVLHGRVVDVAGFRVVGVVGIFREKFGRRRIRQIVGVARVTDRRLRGADIVERRLGRTGRQMARRAGPRARECRRYAWSGVARTVAMLIN
jgi:hypothetical protein